MKAFVLPFVPPAVPSGPKQKTTRALVRLTLVVFSGLLAVGVSRAEADMITWHWAGPVTGHLFAFGQCPPGADCGPRLESVVPVGTTVDVFVSLDLGATPNANCFAGNPTATFQVLGRTYTNIGFLWLDGMGFGPGMCAPNVNWVEVVAPSWG